MRNRFIFTIIVCLLQAAAFAQSDSDMDMVDMYRAIVRHAPARTADNTTSGNLHITVLPAAGYTLQTGFAGVLSGNATFRTTKDSNDNLSTVLASVTYSQYSQVILPVQTYIWTKDNKYNIVTDWRFMKYPQYTYGLGGFTTENNKYKIDYSNIHLYQTVMRKLSKKWYGGIGYNFDYYWNIQVSNPEKGNITLHNRRDVVASGITLNTLYDTRKNPINPEQGSFARVIYRPNFTIMGSNSNWQSLILDVRHYIPFPASSHNVIALWSYDWLTTGGRPPYLMLPSIGWDANSNTGRGYIQGRFRGRNMLYLETEYRFGLTHNGLLGGVVFANAASFSEPVTNRFETVAPGWGTGIRIKLNKFSRTNVAIDYSFGLNGSKGFFVNLGEVF